MCPAAFPSFATLLVRIPNKRLDDMNHFFIGTIQKIIKQREEQPPEQVNLTHLGPGQEVQRVNSYKKFPQNIYIFFFPCFAANRGVEISFNWC